MSMVIYTIRFWDDSGDLSLPLLAEVEEYAEQLGEECACEWDISVEHQQDKEA